MCEHLRTCKTPYLSFVKWCTGSGLAAELLCKPCAEQREAGATVATETVCEACFEFAATEVGDLRRVGGKPEILTRPEPFHTELREAALPRELGPIADLAPIAQARASLWLVLGEDGVIARFNADTGEWSRLATATVPPEPSRTPWAGRVLRRRLHASHDGEFAAVVNDYGRYGQIIDCRSGRVTATLDGGHYHPETVPFAFAFTEMQGRVVAVHRTKLNRLDLGRPQQNHTLLPRLLLGPRHGLADRLRGCGRRDRR